MLKVTVSVPEASIKAIKKAIEKKLIQVLEDVSLQTYNYILTNEYPYFSGSYISSWNINAGSPDTSYNAPLLNQNAYPVPTVKMQLGISNAYQPVYISNYAPHSMDVEVLGTPRHPTPWLIAAGARNHTLMSYRYF